MLVWDADTFAPSHASLAAGNIDKAITNETEHQKRLNYADEVNTSLLSGH